MEHVISTLDDIRVRYAWFEQMRATQPIWLDEQSGYWHVFRYAEVERVITDFSSFPSQGVCNSILGMDPPQHRSYRNLITSALTPRAIERLKGRVAEITQALLDQVRHKGEMDIVTELAYPLPVTVIAELLGIPPTDQPLFKRWADGLLGQQLSDARLFQPDEQEIQRLGQVHAQMHDYFTMLLEEHAHVPHDDLMSALLQASTDGKRLSIEEAIEFCKLLLIAGHVTTTDLLSQAIRCFDERPDVLERVRKQPELLPGAIEEVLRFASPFWRLTRMTRTEVYLAGSTIPAGALVFAWLASANRDAEAFPDPELFDITRTPNRHLAFGHGIHFCIGAPLARMEAAVALPMILKQLPNVRVIREKPLELFEGEFVFGLKHLPVQFDTEAEKRMPMNPERPNQRHANPAVRRPYSSPSAWFEAVYTEAENDCNKVPWAKQTHQPLLLSWLEQQKELANGNRHTLVVGCGLGDDAETLAQHDLSVTAFDISPRAIAWCRQRFPASTVVYQVADLFHLSGGFRQAFDLVYDAFTIQALPPDLHAGAITAIADCVAPGGILLLICFGREPEEPTDGPPWPLARTELDRFVQHGLQEVYFQEHMIGGVRSFFIEYRRHT